MKTRKNIRKKVLLTFLSLLSLSASGENFINEMKTIQLRDGEELITRLCLPKEGNAETIVIAVHGTGPHTYLNKRQGFNYYDVLAEGFCGQGAAFFTYNRRGVTVGDTPPLFADTDSVKYLRYLPRTEAEDIEEMITLLKKDERFRTSRILLYGLSEGTIIAPLVAERNQVHVDGLLLHGYAHENMYDIICWQNTGEGVMILANSIFDKDGDKRISREEFEADEPTVKTYRKYLFQDMPFDTLDVVKDNFIDRQDIGRMRQIFHRELFNRIEKGDDEWIQKNYVYITIGWLREHFALEANKTRLLRLDIPIHIFHGTEDANVPVEGVYDLETRFRVNGKSNLFVHVFEKHNHDLNFQDWIAKKEYSEGMKAVFEAVH